MQKDTRYAPIDGVRSLAHISLVALHASMLLTGFLPSDGPLWEAVKSHPVFTLAQAGGTQVDIFFMLTGLLLTLGLANTSSDAWPSVPGFALKRALRMIPMIGVTILLGHFVMGDCWDMPYTYWDGGRPIFPNRVMSLLLLYTNHCDQITHGSYLGTLMWSCAVDFQVCVVLFILMKLVASLCGSKDRLIRIMRIIFFLLIIIAIIIRGAAFDKDSVNMVMLGQYFHFGLLQPRSSYTWMEEFFGHQWRTSNSAVHKTHAYLNNMYLPTHTRFGPIAVGGFMACCLLMAEQQYAQSGDMRSSEKKEKEKKHSLIGKCFCWLFTFVSISVLVVPCLPAPPPDETPEEAQFVVTAALRIFSASAAAFLLYRCLVPADHPWHFPLFSSYLSLSWWRGIAEISFCSYLIHFRLIMEIIYSSRSRELFGLQLPAVVPVEGQSVESLTNEWLFLMAKVFLIGITASFVCAKILHEFVEKPTASAVRALLTGDQKSKAKKA